MLRFSAVAGIRDIEQLEQLIQSDLAKIGVELQIDNKPAKTFFGEFARHRKFPDMSFYAWISAPDGWSHTLWQDDYIPSEKNNWQGQNYPGWRNREVTELLKRVPSEMDADKRLQLMARVQELFVDELPAIPMYFRPVVAIATTRLKNYQPTGTLTPISWNADKWDLEPANQ